jgi:hypothetical protein
VDVERKDRLLMSCVRADAALPALPPVLQRLRPHVKPIVASRLRDIVTIPNPNSLLDSMQDDNEDMDLDDD